MSSHSPLLFLRPHRTWSRELRILHATDLHSLVAPNVSAVVRQPKRVIGVTNLWMMGRAKTFDGRVEGALGELVRTAATLKPDLIVLSGDLTSLGTEEEFALSRSRLAPLLDPSHHPTPHTICPALIIPGNHDAYTHETVLSRWMEKYFGPWMRRLNLNGDGSDTDSANSSFDAGTVRWQCELSKDPAAMRQHIEKQQQHFLQFQPPSSSPSASPSALPSLPVFALDFLRFLCLDPCRPTAIASRGRYPEKQLESLAALLSNPPKPALPIDHAALEPWFKREEHEEDDAAATPPSTSSSVSARPPSQTPGSSLPFSSAYLSLLSHYPMLSGSGRPYEVLYSLHGVSNGGELRRILLSKQSQLKPHMFLHGHVHRGYMDQMSLDGNGDADASDGSSDPTRPRHQLLSFNPGSGGQAFDPKHRRTAAFNLYTIRRTWDTNRGRIEESEGMGPTAPSVTAASSMRSESGSDSATSVSSSPSCTDEPTLSPAVAPVSVAIGQPLSKRQYPDPQSPPPFPPSSRSTSSRSSESSIVTRKEVEGVGARGGVHSVCQHSSDGQERYMVSLDRYIYDGKQGKFVKEEFPFTSGF